MTCTKLPREHGVWLKCDGTQELHDPTACSEKTYTGNIMAAANRDFAAKTKGWGRGLRKGYKRRDLCPKHMQIERELHAKQRADWEATKKRREEIRKLEREAAAAKKEPRKRKSKAAQESATASTSSPSADSAPAPAS